MFLYSHWRLIDLPIRIKIAGELGIKKVGPTHVRDNVIESDGYLIGDVENALSLENLQKHFNTAETDMDTLWNWLIKGKPLSPPTVSEAVVVLTEITSTEDVKTKKRKQNKGTNR